MRSNFAACAPHTVYFHLQLGHMEAVNYSGPTYMHIVSSSQKMGSGHGGLIIRLGFMLASFPGSRPVGHITCSMHIRGSGDDDKSLHNDWNPPPGSNGCRYSHQVRLSFYQWVWLHKTRLQMKYSKCSCTSVKKVKWGPIYIFIFIHTHLTTTCSYACA